MPNDRPVDPEPQYSAAALIAQARHTEAVLGPAVYARAVATLTAREQQTLRELTAVGWHPLALSERLMRAAAEIAGREYGAFHDEIVRHVIAENYRTIWRVLLSLTSDEALVARAGSMVHRVYDRGAVAAKMLAPGRCELVVSEWPAMPERAVQGMRVAVHTILELSRRRGVAVVVHRTPDGARYDMRWDV